MFEYIVRFLIMIVEDKGISYEDWFPEIILDIFKELRVEILIPNSYLIQNLHQIFE